MQSWDPNQALNDKDKSLDAGERLTLTGLTPGALSLGARGFDEGEKLRDSGRAALEFPLDIEPLNTGGTKEM